MHGVTTKTRTVIIFLAIDFVLQTKGGKIF